MSPLTDTELPNASPAKPSGRVRTACWLQVVPERTKTNAAPGPGMRNLPKYTGVLDGSPMTAVYPLIDTETES